MNRTGSSPVTSTCIRLVQGTNKGVIESYRIKTWLVHTETKTGSTIGLRLYNDGVKLITEMFPFCFLFHPEGDNFCTAIVERTGIRNEAEEY